jgi:ubiquinone/menaquinone biosynthesis C-methylase UbiE
VQRPAAEIRDVREAQAGRDDWAVVSQWSDAGAVWDHLRRDTNIVRAAELLDWPRLIPAGATVLDLGCGGGWLSAMLSAKPQAGRIIAWDSSPALLRDVVPEMVELVGGDGDRIECVCGDFVPLLLDDGSVDVVVMSSAFHHAERPEALLDELARVLAPGGTVILLNETPWHPVAVFGFATRMYAAALLGLAGRVTRRPGHLGSRHVLYDETLGDRAYTLRAWRQMMASAGWSMEVRDTGLFSYPPEHRPPGRWEPRLVHFVLRRHDGGPGPGSPAGRK